MFKKLFKSVLLFSICIGVTVPTNAAVSVSDGSAFVTKSEFNADLNNLSNRMANLESSLDAKIDNLVSSYLTRNGIWNGELQQVQNNLGTNCFTSSSMRIFEDITKSGLMLLPYYLKIDFFAGAYNSNYSGSTSDATYQRACGSPIFYMLGIKLNVYNEVSLASYQSDTLIFTPCGEYDNANSVNYAQKVNQEPSGIFTFFVQKGDNIAYSLSTSLQARMDWWAQSSEVITGNEKNLSGKLMGTDSRTTSWIDGSYYKTYFGISGNEISVY